MAFPSALAFIDFETTTLPDEDSEREVIDYSGVHVLEFAIIITNFDLEPISGYEEVLRLTPAGADALRANEVVLEMHKANGLLKESIYAPEEHTLEYVENEVLSLIKDTTTLGHGEFIIAGSGVAAFDQGLIKTKMPKLARMLAYYPLDAGVVRRALKIFSGGVDVYQPVKASYQDGVKLHRAMDDVKSHLLEAQRQREWVRSVLA